MPHVLQQLARPQRAPRLPGPLLPSSAVSSKKVFKLPWKIHDLCHQLGPQARDLLVAFNFFDLHLKLGHGDSLGLDLAVTRGCATVEHAVGCLEGAW